MLHDAIPLIQGQIKTYFSASRDSIEFDAELDPKIPWRPHVIQRHGSEVTAWYILSEVPDTDFWVRKLLLSQKYKGPGVLSIGLVCSSDIIRSREVLGPLSKLKANLLLYKQDKSSLVILDKYNSFASYVWREGVKLEFDIVKSTADFLYEAALKSSTKHEKGRALERLVAFIFSQVEGFKIESTNYRNATQEIDIVVANNNYSGILANSPIVVIEAKNWTKKVDVVAFNHFQRKVSTRFKRCNLGYLITTSSFTRDVELERLRDSQSENLIALINRSALNGLWQTENITGELARITRTAAAQ